MDFDFYHLGCLPTHLQNLGVARFSPPTKLANKVLAIEVTRQNLELLKTQSQDQVSNCSFIYHYDDSQDLTHLDWHAVFNLFKPQFLLSTTALKASHFTESLIKVRKEEQNMSMQRMLIENRSEMKRIHDAKIKQFKKLEQKLIKAKKRAEQIKIEEELNLKCLGIIFNSKSIGEIEDKILPTLQQSLGLVWMRILVSPTDILTDLPVVKLQGLYKTDIFDLDHDKKSQGKVIFAFKKNTRHKTGTNLLLQRICDGLSLRIKQLTIENEIENTKTQWESTFRSLPFKAALIDKNYNIIQTGGEFKHKKNSKPCYKTFFNRSKPCPNCKLGENFLIDQKNESLEVNSKKVFDTVLDEHYFLNFYRDFEVSTLGESRKATKTKLEELGIISGSIAHELNNPLGGIKILIELLDEDLQTKTEDQKLDLNVLKDSADRCIHIVSELLNFTRPRKSKAPLEKNLQSYFQQLKVFTQAYLVSEGFVLHVVESKTLQLRVTSPDSTLPIKLLESIDHFIKEVNKKSLRSIKEIYLYANFSPSGFKISFSSLPPSDKDLKPSPFRFEDQLVLKAHKTLVSQPTPEDQSLSIEFQYQVKTSETHV